MKTITVYGIKIHPTHSGIISRSIAERVIREVCGCPASNHRWTTTKESIRFFSKFNPEFEIQLTDINGCISGHTIHPKNS